MLLASNKVKYNYASVLTNLNTMYYTLLGLLATKKVHNATCCDSWRLCAISCNTSTKDIWDDYR